MAEQAREVRVFLLREAGYCSHYLACNGVVHAPVLRMLNRHTDSWEWLAPPAARLAEGLDRCDCLKLTDLPPRLAEIMLPTH